jgi:ABC-2 type transport system permease protein
MKALAAENLRRYWTVAFVAGLGYFLVTVLPVLLNYHHYNQVEDYTRMTLAGHNPMVLTIDVVLAVIISVCVLDYLHRQAACIVVHSMPAKRSHLFNASIISGMLLMLLPLVVVAVMLLFCGGASGTVELHGAKGGHETVRASDQITLMGCGIWILKNLIVCGYTFVVSCLAGVVAGTRAIHVLTALFFNSLPGIIIGAWFGYAYLFLKGFYVDDGTLMNLWGRTSPVLYCGLSSELIGSTTLGFSGFVLATVVLGAAAYFVYGRVKLEREGDATVFPLMSDLLCMAVSFVCMSGFASVAAGLSTIGNAELNSQFLLYAIISGTVFFLIFRMVADNSTHIFNLKNLLKFGVFVVLTAVLFAFTVFDVQGFGKKVPAVSDVASVSIHCEEIFNRDAVFTDPAQIETVTKVHKLATESTDQADYMDYLISGVVIRYKMTDGSTIVRQYDLRQKEFEVLQGLQGTKPFRDALMLEVTGSGKSLKINGAKADMV